MEIVKIFSTKFARRAYFEVNFQWQLSSKLALLTERWELLPDARFRSSATLGCATYVACRERATHCHTDCQEVSRCCTRGWIWGIRCMRRRGRTQARDPPWLWNPGETSSEVQNRGISASDPTKRTHVLEFFFFFKCQRFSEFLLFSTLQ